MLLAERNGNKKGKGNVPDASIHIFIRDAWKKLEGMTELEAKHKYVEILLQVAMEVIFIYNMYHSID